MPNRIAAIDPRTVHEWKAWTSQWHWHRFVTLALNRPDAAAPTRSWGEPATRLFRDKLRAWDARMQRRLFGSAWASLHDRRFFATYTLEKASSNPHWHGLVHFYDAEGTELVRQMERFDKYANLTWTQLVSSGDAVVKADYDQAGLIDYVAKSLGGQVNYENFVPPDSFWRP